MLITISLSPITVGNIPILFNILPNNFGTYLIKDSEQIKISNYLAHFFISFLSLLNFLSPSTSIDYTPYSLA